MRSIAIITAPNETVPFADDVGRARGKRLVAFFLLVMTIGFSINCGLAQNTGSSPPVDARAITPLPNGQSAGASDIEKTLDKIRGEVDELKRKMEKPPKDSWDKIAAISGFASAIAVALIGFYATNVYNRRQNQAEAQRKDQEVLLARIQTVEKFIPHLSSSDQQIKAAALVAIAALGNDEFAVKFATAFRGPGATSALTAIASDESSGGSPKARSALLDTLKYLEPRVVSVHVDGVHRAGGFIVDKSGLVVTTAHAVKDIPRDKLTVVLHTARILPAQNVAIDEARDLALIIIDAEETLLPLDLSPSIPEIGSQVTAMLFGRGTKHRLEFGIVNAIDVHFPGTPGGSKIGVALKTEPGDSGAPVVDREGRLIGLVQMNDRKGTAFLISAADALAFVKGSVPIGNPTSG